MKAQTKVLSFIQIIISMSLMACTAVFNADQLEQASEPAPSTPAPTTPAPTFKTAPKVSKVNTQLDSPSSTTFSWQKVDNGNTVLGYRVSYQTGSTPPANCNTPNIDESTLTTTSYSLTSLTPGQMYSVRICSVTEDEVSAGETLTFITLPTCDYTVASGSLDNGTAGGLSFTNTVDGVDSYVEFNNFLAAANTSGDLNADGLISICLGNGLNVITNTSFGSNSSEVAYDNMFIYANAMDTATFVDQRTGYNGKFGLRITSNNVSVANLNFQSTSQESTLVVTGQVNFMSGITISSTANPGPSEGEIVALTGSIDYLNDIVINTNTVSAAVYCWNTIKNMTNITISGSFERGIYYRNLFAPTNVYINNVDITGARYGLDITQAKGTINNVTVVGPVNQTNSTGALFSGVKDLTLSNFKFTSDSTSSGIRGIYFSTLNVTGNILDNVELILKGTDSSGVMVSTGEIASLKNSTIEIQGDNSYGVFVKDGKILSMQDNIIRRNSLSVSTNNSAIAFQDNGTGYFDTNSIKNNTICSTSTSADTWSYLLGSYGNVSTVIDSEYSSATVAYTGSNSGIQTFPWGDSSTSGNSGFNLQTKWGGVCP